jgi:hypothetical protein
MQTIFEKTINGMFIDPLIFTQKFVKGCDVCICSGECCYYGVYTDKEESEKIMTEKEKIIRYMDDSQTKDSELWFEEPQVDNDFPSGLAVGTEVHNEKCVFLDRQGFCTLQKMAMAEGEFKWKYKPLYCILFPLVISEGVLTVDDEHLNDMHYCSKLDNQISTVFDACKNELIFLLGKKGFEELDNYRKEYFEKIEISGSNIEAA